MRDYNPLFIISLTLLILGQTLSLTGKVSNTKPLTLRRALDDLRNTPHIVIPNRSSTKSAGYYVAVPYSVLSIISRRKQSEAQVFVAEFKKYGYIPVWNNESRIIGFYTQFSAATRRSEVAYQQRRYRPSINFFIQNLAIYGLSPIVNSKNEVTGLFYASASTSVSFRPSGYFEANLNEWRHDIIQT